MNALNWAWAPDHDWDAIAELTGDESWRASSMRQHLMNLENCTYVPEGTPGHGFDGVIQVSFLHLWGWGAINLEYYCPDRLN